MVGLSGAEAGQIRDALETTARSMSTLNVNTGDFHNTVAAYPEVKSVKASASFPHSMTITVVEQDPVAVVVAGGHRTVVSGDGTLLPNVTGELVAADDHDDRRARRHDALRRAAAGGRAAGRRAVRAAVTDRVDDRSARATA